MSDGILLYRPARYGLIDLIHQSHGLRQGYDYFLIVHEVIERKLPAPAVLEPFFQDLIAAHVKLPDLFGYTLKVLGLVDEDVARLALFDTTNLGKPFSTKLSPATG